jgi:hypothetical protein
MSTQATTSGTLSNPNPQPVEVGVIAVAVAMGGVVITVLLKIAEALMAGQISISTVAEIPDIQGFLFNEYFTVGIDLVVVAFSFIVGVWVNSRKDTGKRAALVGPLFMMFICGLLALLTKGFADQAVSNLEAKLASGQRNAIEKFQAIQHQCKPASPMQVEPAPPAKMDTKQICTKYANWKGIQIWIPVVLALFTSGIAVIVANRR